LAADGPAMDHGLLCKPERNSTATLSFICGAANTTPSSVQDKASQHIALGTER